MLRRVLEMYKMGLERNNVRRALNEFVRFSNSTGFSVLASGELDTMA
jgi:hypothetical protein